MTTEHEDGRGGFYYVTADGQRYHYEWCHDCGSFGCEYCGDTGQVRVADNQQGETPDA